MKQMRQSAASSAAGPATCTGQTLVETLEAATAWLGAHAERINALNVFPVPDGDTGTNMLLTMRSALERVTAPKTKPVNEVARLAAQGALMGARGNSGVILSQLLRGFASALENSETLSARDLACALAEASRVAYRGVSSPVEGTLLTVAREVAEAAEAAVGPEMGTTDLLERCVRAAEVSVEGTPELLEVLSRAGVVDAGGEGYRVLLEGAWMHLTGQKMEMAAASQPAHVLARAREADETPYGFCTELMVGDLSIEPSVMREAMEALGQSVIVVGDRSLVRVHVHALRPGQVLDYAVENGTVQQVKIENMELQHAEFVASHTGRADGLSKIGVVAVVMGDGFKELYRSLGVAAVVDGGQTMNPSVQEILAAVNGAAYEDLVLLPNNANVIMTANHVRGLTARRLEVVPTTNLAQGVAALMAFNYQDDLPTNAERMQAAVSAARTVEVTTAVRDAEANGRRVRRGDLVAVLDEQIIAAGGKAASLIEHAVRQLGATDEALLTLYYGEQVSQEEAQQLAERLSEMLPGPSWEVVHGGQPHYSYIISLEG